MTHSRLLALVCFVSGVVCLYESQRLWTGWGAAGLMPAITAALLICLAVAFCLVQQSDRETLSLPSALELRSVAIVTASFAAYIALVGLIGYLLSTWLVLSLITKTTSQASTRTAIIWPGLLAGGSFLLFKAVGTHLPPGVLGM